MNGTPQSHFEWMDSYIALLSLIQLGVVAYWWRSRTRPFPFAIIGLVALGVLAALLFTPDESRVVAVNLPRDPGKSVANPVSYISVFVTVVLTLLFVGINQLILLGVRAVVNRVWR
jgi:hypothetical protein